MKPLNEIIRTRKDLQAYCQEMKSMPGFAMTMKMKSMNDILKENYGIENETLNTYKKKKKKGFQVIKGSKAYTLWSSPIDSRSKELKEKEEKLKKEGYAIEENLQYYICKLFSSKQVHKIKKSEG